MQAAARALDLLLEGARGGDLADAAACIVLVCFRRDGEERGWMDGV